MILLNPKNYQVKHDDPKTTELIQKTIEFFEQKGLASIKEDDQASRWCDDFLSFIGEEKVFATMLTPKGYGQPDSRWDMSRIAEYNEILGFYGLSFWYMWQVTILGLGPIWMSPNEDLKKKAAQDLLDGGIFAFGLSERAHGADIYSTEMTLTPKGDGTYLASGSKYYIGNGQKAAMVSTFGKMADTGDYVFFNADPKHSNYHVVKKIETSGVRPAFVAAYDLKDYPVTEDQILSKGDEAFASGLNTVNIGKFELGFASIGISTHAFYEAIRHATHRNLYGRSVTDFPHVKKLFVESYARLTAMKLYGLRAADYMRVASSEDRRYLLYNPIMKMKVTSQGEQVVGMLHDVIAAKGFEQDTYFEMAIRDIGMLPKLEGTTHVNMALIIKFIQNYFFKPTDYPEIPRQMGMDDDAYLFQQTSGKLGDVKFPAYDRPYGGIELSNVKIFKSQVEDFKQLLMKAPPTPEQSKNVDFLLAGGELFTLIAYAQLILENRPHMDVGDALTNQIFNFMVRDFSSFALHMVLNHQLTPEQETIYQAMIKKPDHDLDGFSEVWNKEVKGLESAY